MTLPLTDVRFTEYPAVFQGGGNDLFGVLTEPARGRARGTGVILLTGGAFIASTNRNRLSVRMARSLAEEGFHVLRFDYHGVGESTGFTDGFPLYQPFVGDLQATLRWFGRTGVKKVVLVGSCFGARTIMAAADQIEGLAGAVLMSAPLRDFDMGDRAPTRYAREMSLLQLIRKAARPQTIRNLLAPRSRETHLRSRHVYARTAVMKARMILGRLGGRMRSSPDGLGAELSDLFVRPMRWFIAHAIPVLLLYGTEEDYYREFVRARQGSLRDLFDGRYPSVEVETVEGVLHGFTSLQVQEDAFTRTVAWVRRF